VPKTPHKDKLLAAIDNPKSRADVSLLREALAAYETWMAGIEHLTTIGKQRVPEDSRLTDIDNVFLLRHAKRLPSDKRSVVAEVEKQHRDFPIDGEIIYRFVQEIENFLEAVWHDPAEALKRGSFA
jgi:hypothetical protein